MQTAENIFKWYKADPEKLEGFRVAMNTMAPPRMALLPCLDTSVASAPGSHIVDVGGGVGHILAEMLRLRPQVCTLQLLLLGNKLLIPDLKVLERTNNRKFSKCIARNCFWHSNECGVD